MPLNLATYSKVNLGFIFICLLGFLLLLDIDKKEIENVENEQQRLKKYVKRTFFIVILWSVSTI